MRRSNLTRLLDRAIDGGLEDFLATRRTAGDSYATIAAALLADYDIDVTRETVRQWCNELVKAEPEAAAS